MKIINLHDFVIAQLAATKTQWPEISVKSGVPYSTLTKIATKQIKDPGYSKIDALARCLSSKSYRSAA